jgi:threonine 3-dehydrogenase
MSGNPAALRDMIDSMCHGGKIAMLGIPTESVPFDWTKVVFSMLTIKGIYGREMYETWYKMTVMLETGLNIKPAITHRFHFSEFEKGFEVMMSGKSGKVIITWVWPSTRRLRAPPKRRLISGVMAWPVCGSSAARREFTNSSRPN